ncbi:hypothetical protein [Ferrimonas sp. SCSIO 43195]|uniref:hypothetical protein n=1 Tax=Ferrimonas sp. SCSIO 43195 TaxID=2822844 RepID=UPI002075C923|nr:hypothetical protein [Ferrimonas sp. SCSIO 43195]USD39466.1 hypothetical protein J8Z22_10410 [Ferrimonas sp. SCSIO 43195]
MIRLFRSMRLGCVLLTLAALWFALGMALAELWGYRWPLKQLNQLPLSQWQSILQHNLALLAWLVSLVVIFALLGLSTLVCSYHSLWPLWKRRKLRHRHFLLLPIHLLTLLIFACHGLDILWAHQPQHLNLATGESAQFEGYTVTLDRIDYRDNVSLIRQDQDGHSRAGRITRRSLDQFDPARNWATFTVSHDQSGQRLQGRAGFLSPLVFGHRRLTVTDFFVPYAAADSALSVKLTLTNNPLSGWFIGCYLALLAALIGQIVHRILFSSSSEQVRC